LQEAASVDDDDFSLFQVSRQLKTAPCKPAQHIFAVNQIFWATQRHNCASNRFSHPLAPRRPKVFEPMPSGSPKKRIFPASGQKFTGNIILAH
jgi:hypothetical protein